MEYKDYLVYHVKHEEFEKWYFMHKKQIAFGCCSRYYDEPLNIILSDLSVTPSERRKGLATELQILRENLGKEMGCTNAYLWVKKQSWMESWYNRRGYIIYSEMDFDNKWMIKTI